jgi:hypothetical protein
MPNIQGNKTNEGAIMSLFVRFAANGVALLGMTILSSAHAATLNVNCGSHEGNSSINAAIKALAGYPSRGQNVINVRGVCNENVVFQGVNHITLDGGNNATIVDHTGGTTSAILIDSSQEIWINNLTATGTGQGSGDWDVIDCQVGSTCRFTNVTVQNSAPTAGGIGVWVGSFMSITGSLFQNNKGWGGVIAGNGGEALVQNSVSKNNWAGGVAYHHGYLQMYQVSVAGNDYLGAQVYSEGHFMCNTCTISGNGLAYGADGITVQDGSSVSLRGPGSVTGNGGVGVRLSNLSNLEIGRGGTISGNLGGIDVLCQPSYTTATVNGTVGTISGCP